MAYDLYAMLFRMKNINRWALMHRTSEESLTRHSFETALIAHALAVITNEKFGGNVDAEKTAVVAMFHDAPEILTGDLPTPVKHGNAEIETAYEKIEEEAIDLFVSMSPDYMKKTVEGVFRCDDEQVNALVKAADKISALIKCREELSAGNREFRDAEKSTAKAIKKLGCPAADEFVSEFLPAFERTLDELKGCNS